MAGFHLAASVSGPGIVHASSLSHLQYLLGRLNKTELSLVLLVTPVLSLLKQVKMSAVKKARC